MPANITYWSPTSRDADIITSFGKIAKELEQDRRQSSVTIHIAEGYQYAKKYSLSSVWSQQIAQHAEEHDTSLWSNVSVDFIPLDVSVTILRDRERGDDEIRIRYKNDPNDAVLVTRGITAVQRQFAPLNRAAEIERALGPEIAEFYRRREEGLSRLETLSYKLTEETHNYRIRLDGELDQHKRALTESFEEKTLSFEEGYDKRNAELEKREHDLERHRKDLDDRSARHARREQSRSLQQKIADRSEKFSLTSDTRKKRLPIHFIFIVLLTLSGGVAAHSLLLPIFGLDSVTYWLDYVRMSLGSLGFALTAIFYIRWNDQWFRQHADQEFKLHQLALDVDRAGYAAEMLLEWQEDKEGQMPAVMVDRITAGLFTEQANISRVHHPSEDVMSALLKASSNVRVDVPGIGEVTLSGSQIRKLDKRLEKRRD